MLGCAGNATTALSAGDALGRVADQLDVAVDEYHNDVASHDDRREAEVASAFVARVVANAGDQDKLANDQAQFLMAMAKIRGDREVEWDRRNATKENIDALREVAKGMRRLALDSLSLNDEMRRYLTGWYDTYEQSKAARAAEKAANKQAQVDQRNTLIKTGVGAVAPQYSPLVDQILGTGGAK